MFQILYLICWTFQTSHYYLTLYFLKQLKQYEKLALSPRIPLSYPS